jgi:hypothetical protein
VLVITGVLYVDNLHYTINYLDEPMTKKLRLHRLNQNCCSSISSIIHVILVVPQLFTQPHSPIALQLLQWEELMITKAITKKELLSADHELIPAGFKRT